MFIGENLFNSFATTAITSTSSLDGDSLNLNSHSDDLILHEAPKLDNNDLLLENLDFNLMNQPLIDDEISNSDSDKMAPFVIDSDVFNSVFKNENDPLLENIDLIDNDLKDMFDLVDSDINIKKEDDDEIDININIENRSKSTPAIPLSTEFLSNNKRSFSTANLDDNSSSSSSLKKDKLGCTPYTRKQRNNPLPPVVVKGEDLASVKRARNTEAARRSRARKMERMSQLEDKCEGLLKENEDLKAQIKALKSLLGQ